MVIDELRTANWQRSNEGRKRAEQTPHPKPFPRPGVGAKRAQQDKNSPARQEARQRAMRRAAERRRAKAAGEIT